MTGRRTCTAQNLVEFAIVAPFLFLFVFGIIEFGWAFYVHSELTNAAREGARYAAVLGTVGFVDIPIIHMSVRWWRTLHPQPIVVRSEGPNMPTEMLVTMLVTLVAFIVLYLFLLIVKYRIETVRDAVLELRAETAN